MYRQTYVMDLNDQRQYTLAQTLLAQSADSGRYDTILHMKYKNVGESILNGGSSNNHDNDTNNDLAHAHSGASSINSSDGFENIDIEKANKLKWPIPKTGILEMEMLYFRERQLLTDREFKSFLQEVRCQNSEMLKLEMLRMSCQGSFYLSVAMIGTLAKEFQTIQGQRDCVSILLKNLSEIQFELDLYELLQNSRAEINLWIDIVELGKLGKKDGKDCEVL